MRAMLQYFGGFVVAVAIAACAPTRYEYVPVQAARLTSAETSDGPVAVTRPIEANRPSSGSVRVVVLGTKDITSVDGKGDVPALHVRMTVSNPTDGNWTVDGAEQRIELPSKDDRVAIYAMSPRGGRAPLVDAFAKRTTTLDLYYPFPPRDPDPSHVPRFDVVWTVRTGEASVSGRTPFERVVASPPISKDREAPGSYFSSPFNAEGSFWPPPDAIGYPPDNRERPFANPR